MRTAWRAQGRQPPARQQQQQQQQQQHSHRRCLGLRGPCRQQERGSITAAAVAAGPEPSRKKQKPSTQQQQQPSRNASLYELTDHDGWGVEAVSGPAAVQQQPVQQPAAQQQKQQSRQPGKRAKAATPYANLRGQEGKLGLTLLQRMLEYEEAEQQQQQQGSEAAGAGTANTPSLDDIKARLATAGSSSKQQKPKLLGFPKASLAAGGAAAGGAAAAAAGRQAFGAGDVGSDEDWEEGEDDEDESTPAFQISFDPEGRVEMESFGTSEASPAAAAAAAGTAVEEEEDLDDFGMSGWGQFGAEEEEPEPLELQQQQKKKKSKRGKAAAQVAADDADDDAELTLLRDLSNEDDWGLESLATPGLSSLSRQLRPGRRSLVDELTAADAADDGFGSSDSGFSGNVQWGGSAGTTGIDLDEQEALLTRYFRPDQVKKLMQEQQEVDESYSVLRKRAVGMGVSDHKLQEKLRIVSGSAAGRKLVSFKSPQTRPMMEKVRQAIFNMLQSRAGTLNSLPTTARWLDLFAGTGSVGLEALSRGCREAHFVEMDQVVVSKVLERNIKGCGFKGRAWTHTSKAEDFLRRSAAVPRFAGGPFDFISVCPPYLLVSYPELFELLDVSPLVHPGTLLFVEYPKQLAHQVVDSIGPLQRVKDRRYGRTWVALYAAAADGGDGEDEAEEDPFLAMQM